MRRIGKVVAEQVALYGTLTGAKPAPKRASADVGRVPRAARPREGRGPQGRRVAGAHASRCAPARASRTRWRGSGTRCARSTSAPDLVDRLIAERPDVAFVALHGRGGEDGTVQELLELVGVPYTASRPGACIRCMDKVVAKHALRDAGHPDARLLRVLADRVRGARRRPGAAGDRGAARTSRSSSSPPGQGSALGIKFARTAADVPHALVAAFSYDTKVLLERYVAGRDLAVSVLDSPTGREALPVVEAIPMRGGLLRLRGALRDRPHALRLPGRPVAGADRARAGARAGDLAGRSAAPGSRAWT